MVNNDDPAFAPVNGTDIVTRLMWVSSRTAFRVGGVNGNEVEL